jgi:hypothetical protein
MPAIVLAHRFPPGTRVELYRMTGGGASPVTQQLIPWLPSDLLDVQHVDAEGVVRFEDPPAVESPVWARPNAYFAVGLLDGRPLAIRCQPYEEEQPIQPPVMPDRQRQVVAPARTCTLLKQVLYDRERGYDRDSLYRPPNENCPCEFCVADRGAA